MGAKSTLLFRNAHWGTPRLIAGLIPFKFVFTGRLGQALVRYLCVTVYQFVSVCWCVYVCVYISVYI